MQKQLSRAYLKDLKDSGRLIYDQKGWERRKTEDLIERLGLIREHISEKFAVNQDLPGAPYVNANWSDYKYPEISDGWGGTKLDRSGQPWIDNAEWGEMNAIRPRDWFRTHKPGVDYGYGDPNTVFVPKKNVPMPPVVLPQIGVALLDLTTMTATLYDSETLTEQGSVYVSSAFETAKTKPYFNQIMKRATAQGVSVLPVEIYETGLSEAYPYVRKPGRVAFAKIANDETRVALVGGVANRKDKQWLYVHMAGHKSSVRSILASFSQAGRKYISAEGGGGYLQAYSTHAYQRYDIPLTDFGQHYMSTILVDRRIVDPYVHDYSVSLKFANQSGVNPARQFIERLRAVEATPILRDWESLFEIAQEQGLTERLSCFGSVTEAWAIKASDYWAKLVGKMLRNGELVIPEVE